MQISPNLAYSTGELVVFYEDKTMTTFGPDIVGPAPELLNQRFNISAPFLCHRMAVSTRLSTHMICQQSSNKIVVVNVTDMGKKERTCSGLA